MAGGAIRSARAPVNVIFGMTAEAVLRKPRPFLTGMACEATQLPVRTNQPKSRLCMIKGKRLLPIEHRVTGLAILAEPTKVRILLGVARGAACPQTPVMRVVAVASGTSGLRVATNERVIGQLVVEPIAVEPCQLRSPAMMLAMTGLARLTPRVRLAVKARPPLYVGGYTLVTGQAFSILSFARKRGMAGVAIGFEFGMSTTKRPRRDQPLHQRLGATRLRKKNQAQDSNEARP